LAKKSPTKNNTVEIFANFVAEIWQMYYLKIGEIWLIKPENQKNYAKKSKWRHFLGPAGLGT